MSVQRIRSACSRLEAMDVPDAELLAIAQEVIIETDLSGFRDTWHATLDCTSVNGRYLPSRSASINNLIDDDPSICSCLTSNIDELAEWLYDTTERIARLHRHTDAILEAIRQVGTNPVAVYGELHVRLATWPGLPKDVPDDIQDHFGYIRERAQETLLELDGITDKLLDAEIRGLCVFDLDQCRELNAAFVGHTDIWHAWVDAVRSPEAALAAALEVAGEDRQEAARRVVARAEAELAKAMDAPTHMIWARDLCYAADGDLESRFSYEIYALLLFCGLPGTGVGTWCLLDHVPAVLVPELNHADACCDLGERVENLDMTATRAAMLTLTEGTPRGDVDWRAAFDAACLLMTANA